MVQHLDISSVCGKLGGRGVGETTKKNHIKIFIILRVQRNLSKYLNTYLWVKCKQPDNKQRVWGESPKTPWGDLRVIMEVGEYWKCNWISQNLTSTSLCIMIRKTSTYQSGSSGLNFSFAILYEQTYLVTFIFLVSKKKQ